jgi:hypothetical protein
MTRNGPRLEVGGRAVVLGGKSTVERLPSRPAGISSRRARSVVVTAMITVMTASNMSAGVSMWHVVVAVPGIVHFSPVVGPSDLRKGSGAEGNRTPDLFHAMEALYQLSYSPSEVETLPAGPSEPVVARR